MSKFQKKMEEVRRHVAKEAARTAHIRRELASHARRHPLPEPDRTIFPDHSWVDYRNSLSAPWYTEPSWPKSWGHSYGGTSWEDYLRRLPKDPHAR